MHAQPKLKVTFKNPFKSVGLKLFIIFFVSSIVFVLGIGLYSYSQSKTIIKEQSSEANYQTMVQAREKLDLIFSKYEDLSMQLLMSKELQENLNISISSGESDYNKFSASKKVSDILQQFSVTNASISGISLIPMKGDTHIESTNGTGANVEEIRKKDWFIDALKANGRTVYIPTQTGRLIGGSQEQTFGMARQLKDVLSGRTSHVLLIELKVSEIGKNLTSINLGDGSDLLLLGLDNQVVYSQKPELITQKSALVLPEAQEANQGASATVTNETGKDFLVSYSPLAASGWKLVSEVPVKKLVEKASYIFNITIISAVIATIVAALVGLWVVGMVGRPLNHLRNLMNQGANGNLAVRTKIKTEDEIGQLSRGFNEMMDNITSLVQHTSQSASDVLHTASELSDASKKTAISAREIAVATEEIANGASNLAVEAERGNDLTITIGTNMSKVIESNMEMGTAASEVERVSEQGISHMNTLTEKTSLTEEMVRSLVQKVNALKESTNSIRKILDVLSNMTKQTNILSLNATIEASRAGAAGKGFMVVADEIRKLADQSRQSISIVGEITDKISGEIVETVDVLSTAYPIFQEQILSVREANEIFWTVQGQMGGFIQQLDQTTDSIQQLDQSQATLAEAMSNVSAVAEEASATSEEVASLSNEQLSVSSNLIDLSNKLEEVSTRLKETLSRFTL
ncbi:hypothetical protein BVG16_06760 [Paenibacillus selenitireducens]|uniref:Methyl-accepting chemotaxis protein n=1 Tax=Paenibacillus selenitireducens TaxID=1324314 RepID=A0A1T2XKU4_9BACL|nr:methyl-accepting chemotaxis protein [Paenibacillus selenitireducens]OPA80425.1 hypothetical protein BVG16_06760 [Paenibacillus selenitireducens]